MVWVVGGGLWYRGKEGGQGCTVALLLGAGLVGAPQSAKGFAPQCERANCLSASWLYIKTCPSVHSLSSKVCPSRKTAVCGIAFQRVGGGLRAEVRLGPLLSCGGHVDICSRARGHLLLGCAPRRESRLAYLQHRAAGMAMAAKRRLHVCRRHLLACLARVCWCCP